MARSSTTKPKRPQAAPAGGDGHGPANGSAPFSADNQPPPEAKSAGHDVAAEIRARIAARRNEIFDAQIERALNLEHPQGHQAAAWLGDKLLPPKQEIEANVSSHVIRAPAKPVSVEDWAATYAPRND